MSGGGGGVKTRARKRKVGRRDSLLWDVIVNNDDICFQHILPRLNKTDLKFLYGVNTETRKLIKRSPRRWELKKGVDVKEMSSISTLEVAWENREHKSLWPSWWDENERHFFSEGVARTNKLSCSSGRERRKSVSGMKGRLVRPQEKVIWKW